MSSGARHGGANPIDQLGNWSADLLRQQAQIEEVRRVLQEKVNALAMRVGQMNANVIRLDALGKRLTRMANLDDGEFDFGKPPPLGGDSGADGQPAQIPNLTAMVDDLQTSAVEPRAAARRAGESDSDARTQQAGLPAKAVRSRTAGFPPILDAAPIRSPAFRQYTRASISRAPRARRSPPWPPGS